MSLPLRFKKSLRSVAGMAQSWMFLFILSILATPWPVAALEADALRELYLKEDFDSIVKQCREESASIEQNELADQILYFCGQAKMKLYEKTDEEVYLTEAVNDLERSAYLYYLPTTAFALGRARIAALDRITDPAERMAVEQQSFGDMWDAIVKRHAQEDFRADVLSDTILSWSISYYEALIERIAKEDEAVSRWLTARVRMLTDRFASVDPSRGENATRIQNLKTISGWMKELYEASYFDNSAAVGMLKFRGDRKMELYDQTDATEGEFQKSLAFYDASLARARSLKAKAVLKERVSYLTSLYNSENKSKKILYYEIGFFHANNALTLMDMVERQAAASGASYPYEPDNRQILSQIQTNYGRNLSGLLYFLWEKENYHKVVTLRNAFDVQFDWKTKRDDLLRIADAASRLATNEFRKERRTRDIVNFETYKEICLTSASQAFKYALEKYNAEGPAYQATFCETLDTFTALLSRFGELAESSNFSGRYSSACSATAGPGTNPP